MTVRIARAKGKRTKYTVTSPPQEAAAPEPKVQCTRLVCLRIDHEVWATLNATAKRMLRAPIAWRTSKKGLRAIPLLWGLGREAYAWVIEGSAPALEVAQVLAMVGVEMTSAPWNYLLRRVPAGGLFTDPARTGTKNDVETMGMPLLLRTRRGVWKRYDRQGPSLWPKGVQEAIAEHVAGTEGGIAPAVADAPPRFVVEEGTQVVRGSAFSFKWQERSAWGTLAEASAEAGRAAIADARVGRTTRWRVLDRGTRAKRALWRARKVGKVQKLTRLDLVPGLATSRPTPVVVDVPGAGAS